MRIISLDITNYRVLKRARVDFPDQVIGIIGPNGGGKSSLVEAIAWALYGNQAARTGKEQIKFQGCAAGDSCEVRLDFDIAGEAYRVVRRLIGRTDRPEVQLYRAGKSESVGVSETNSYISQLLGLDWRGFLTSFLARQQELNALSDLQPSRRRDHLAGMLGIERLDKAIIRVKDDIRTTGKNVVFMEQQMATSDQLAASIADLENRLKQLAVTKKTCQEALETAEKARKAASDRLALLQKTQASWGKLTAAIQSQEQATEELKRQLAAAEQESVGLKDLGEELTDLESKLKPAASVRAQLEQMKTARDTMTAQKDINGRLGQAKREVVEIEKKLVSLAERSTGLSAVLAEIPEDIGRRRRTAEEKLDEARNDFSRLKGGAEAVKTEAQKLAKQISDMTQFGPESVCDRCHRPLGDDLPAIEKHLQEEQAALLKKAGGLDSALAAQVERGQQLKEQTEVLKEQEQKRYQAAVDYESLLKEKQALEGRRDEVRSMSAQLSEKLAEIGKIEFDPALFESLVSRVAELDRLQARREHIAGRLVRQPVVLESIRDLQGKLTGTADKLAGLNREREDLSFSEVVFEEAKTADERARENHTEAREKALSSAKELEFTERELVSRREQLAALEKTRQLLDQARDSLFYGEKLTGLMTDFRGHLIAQIRPTLADLSSRLMADMTNNKYSLVELDEKYNLRVMDGGEFFEIDRFSGGEKDLANLCLRLAISLALTEAAGLERSFVMLDEVFGSQDVERRDLIINALGSLKNRFPQILLITHIEDLRDRVETLVEVSPTGHGYSEVRVNGGTVT